MSWYSSSNTTRVAVAQVVAEHGLLLRDPQGEGDLVGVLDDAATHLLGVVVGGEVGEHPERAEPLAELHGVGVGEPRAVGRQLGERPEVDGERPQFVEIARMLGDAARDGEYGLGERVEVLAELGEAGIPAAHDDAAGELPGRRLAEHRGVALPPEQDRRIAVERVRERVVGRDVRGVEHIPFRQQSGLVEFRDALADAQPELTRRLAGEGQAEHLCRLDQPVREQPEHPVRHRLGLARSGAGDDEGGRERRLDDRLLLRRRMRHRLLADARERVGDFDRRDHVPLTGPTRCRRSSGTAPRP